MVSQGLWMAGWLASLAPKASLTTRSRKSEFSLHTEGSSQGIWMAGSLAYLGSKVSFPTRSRKRWVVLCCVVFSCVWCLVCCALRVVCCVLCFSASLAQPASSPSQLCASVPLMPQRVFARHTAHPWTPKAGSPCKPDFLPIFIQTLVYECCRKSDDIF